MPDVEVFHLAANNLATLNDRGSKGRGSRSRGGVEVGVATIKRTQIVGHTHKTKNAEQKLWSQVKIKGELNELLGSSLLGSSLSLSASLSVFSFWPSWEIDAADSRKKMKEKDH